METNQNHDNHEITLKNHGNQPKTMKNHEITLKNQRGRAGISKNVTYAGSQLTGEGGQGRKNGKNVTYAGSQLTFYMFRFIL